MNYTKIGRVQLEKKYEKSKTKAEFVSCNVFVSITFSVEFLKASLSNVLHYHTTVSIELGFKSEMVVFVSLLKCI